MKNKIVTTIFTCLTMVAAGTAHASTMAINASELTFRAPPHSLLANVAQRLILNEIKRVCGRENRAKNLSIAITTSDDENTGGAMVRADGTLDCI